MARNRELLGKDLRMTGDWTIRPAGTDDAADIALAQLLAWQCAYKGILTSEFLAALDLKRMTEAWRKALAKPSPGVRHLVVCVAGRAVGWSGYGPSRDEADPGTGELQAINLHPAYWSRGLGSALFRATEAGLAELGYRCAYLWVADGNERAARFYDRHGWCADGVSKEDGRFAPALLEHRYSRVLN
jgi:ribosomal protein S18 acetylase RimI-like enzyme